MPDYDSRPSGRPKAPPTGYRSWAQFNDEVVESLEDARRYGLRHQAVIVVLAADLAKGTPCPPIRAAVTARLEEADADAFRAALDEVDGWHRASMAAAA